MSRPAHIHAPKVTIVVLHWENYPCTRRCLESLAKLTYPEYDVIVVDNGSRDDSVEQLQREFPECDFVRNIANLGFARGCNVGAQRAFDRGADYVLLFNNDMRATPGFLQPAVAAAEANPRVGLVTGKILYDDGSDRIWHAGGHIHPLSRNAIGRGFQEVDRGQVDSACNTGWASGAMMLIRRAAAEQAGLLPEEYFFGIEEWDYSTRMLRLGFDIRYVPEFIAYHRAGGSDAAGDLVLMVYNGARNKLIYNQKYLPWPLWHLWRGLFWIYLQVWWPRRAGWGCHSRADYVVRLRAARMAFSDHRGVVPVELADLERAAARLGPTPTWGAGRDSGAPPDTGSTSLTHASPAG